MTIEELEYTLEPGAFAPEKAHEDDAGYDLRTPHEWYILPGKSTTIYTGVHIALKPGEYGKLESKSGLMTKHDITCPGGVIDCGYTGGIAVKLRNDSEYPYHFNAGDKIVQLIIMEHKSPKLKLVEKLGATERGDNGFGSTGR